MVEKLPEMQETWVRYLGWEDTLEKGMATHSTDVSWKMSEKATFEMLPGRGEGASQVKL